MPTFEELLKIKNARLSKIPGNLQTVVQKQQQKVLNGILERLGKLTTVNGQIKIDSANIKAIAEISDELKGVFLNDEYLQAVRTFGNEFAKQASINSKLIEAGVGETLNPIASDAYITTARRNAVNLLQGSAAEVKFIQPVSGILENAVVNGSSVNDTITSLRTFIEGSENIDGQVLKYVKQITNDTFAISDRSYTSIVSDYLESEWFYFAGVEVQGTRCFCEERVGKYFHYKEIESWGRGQNLGTCDTGGKWAGQMPGTNETTIYSLLGGYNCLHSLMPVSIEVVPEEDIQRAINLGYYVPEN